MKLQLLWIIFGVLSAASANAGIEVSLLPADPHVNLQDLEQNPGTKDLLKAKAPWFQTSYSVKNDSPEPIKVSSIIVTAASVEGRKVTKTFPVPEGTIAPGEAKTLGAFFLEGLSDSESLTYSVSAAVQYQQADAAQSTVIQFKTR